MSASDPPALVLCHGYDTGLSAVRALHRHDITVVAVGFDDNLIAWSRVPRRQFTVDGRSPAEKLEGLRRLLETIPAPDRPVLLPTSDVLVEFMCDHRAELEARFSLLMPETSAMRAMIDKADETTLIASLGFALPKTVAPLPPSEDELLSRLPLPIMVKLRKHAYWSVLDRKNVILRSRQEVKRFYADTGRCAHLLVAQELIEAPDEASWLCNAVFDRRHRLAAACVKRKIRMTPPHYGVASIAVSAANSAVLDLAERIGSRTRFVGLANFEFRQDPRDGAYLYIEMNPRFGGGSGGADYDSRIGVPTARTAYRLALGLAPTDVGRQRDGVVYLDAIGDAQTRLRCGESPAAVVRHHAALWWGHPICCPTASWRDPLPGLVALSRWARRRLASLSVTGRSPSSRGVAERHACPQPPLAKR